MLNIEACQIGRYGGGKMCGSPIPGLHRVKLDVEAVGEHMKVQKRRVSLSDWTLEWREACRKSKRAEPACQIGRQSGGKTCRSPKGKSQLAGLDVKAVGKHVEVQKGSHSLSDWTLERRESM